VDDWNAGRLDFLVAHPASCGYGLNLQAGGSAVVWYTPTWSLEEYLQANARVVRQGQGHRCTVLRIIAPGTMDAAVIKALEYKNKTQNAVLGAVRMAFEKQCGCTPPMVRR
jgi:SNF2 family DNA or RNA helicase